MGIWPDANEGLGPRSIDENQLMGIHTDGFARPKIDLSTKMSQSQTVPPGGGTLK